MQVQGLAHVNRCNPTFQLAALLVTGGSVIRCLLNVDVDEAQTTLPVLVDVEFYA